MVAYVTCVGWGAKSMCLESGCQAPTLTGESFSWSSEVSLTTHQGSLHFDYSRQALISSVSQWAWWFRMGHPVQSAAGCCRIYVIMENPDVRWISHLQEMPSRGPSSCSKWRPFTHQKDHGAAKGQRRALFTPVLSS